MEKNKMMLIVIIVLLVLLLGAIAFGGYWIVTNLGGDESEAVEEVVEEEDKSLNTLIPIGDSIYTNLLVGEDKKEHLVKINLSLDIKGGEDESEATVMAINNRLIVVRDIMNNVLRKKTFEELKKNDGLESLKDEILDKLRKEFNTNLISRVLIDEFLLQ